MVPGSDGHIGRPLRICIATHELAGVTSANGLGQATANLARALASAGHHVTVLFAGVASGDVHQAELRYRVDGIELHLLPEHVGAPALAAHPVATAWRVYAWIDERHRATPFDIVHCPDAYGLGALCATACRAGAGLLGARVVIGAHGPMPWIREGERLSNTVIEESVQERLERDALRNADAVVSPSRFLLDYFGQRGWELPEARFVRQNCLDPDLLRTPAAPGGVPAPGAAGEPLHVAFFGRLIRLKGLELFCDALDDLAEAGTRRPLAVSFVGRNDSVGGLEATEYIARRARRWPWAVTVHTDFDQARALAHMAERRALAVIPSLVENSPNTVCEVIAAGIPFVAANTGGIAELIHPDDRHRVLFDVSGDAGPRLPSARHEYVWRPTPGPLAAVLARAVEEAPAPARFAVDPAETVRRHVDVYATIAGTTTRTIGGRADGQAVDLVIDGRHLGGLPAWQGCASQFATTTLVLDGDAPDPGDVAAGWRVIRSDRDASELWDALAKGDAPTVLVASGDLHPVNGLAAAAGSWLAALDASAAVLPAAVMDARGGVCAVVPTVGVPSASLLGPHYVPGATLLSRQAVRRAGPGPALRLELVVQDLLSRLTMAGAHVALVPVISGARAASEADSMASGTGEPFVTRLTRPELTDMLVPFRRSLPPELQDLPGELVHLRALLGTVQQRAAAERTARARLEATVVHLTAERDRLAQALQQATSASAPALQQARPASVPAVPILEASALP